MGVSATFLAKRSRRRSCVAMVPVIVKCVVLGDEVDDARVIVICHIVTVTNCPCDLFFARKRARGRIKVDIDISAGSQNEKPASKDFEFREG